MSSGKAIKSTLTILRLFFLLTLKGSSHEKVQVLLLVMFSLTVLGCTSSQDKAYQAQEGVHKERLALTEKYQKCMDDAGGDAAKAETCDQHLKAAEAL